jgi:hypothetical protein
MPRVNFKPDHSLSGRRSQHSIFNIRIINVIKVILCGTDFLSSLHFILLVNQAQLVVISLTPEVLTNLQPFGLVLFHTILSINLPHI